MGLFGISEVAARLILTYLAQAFIGVVMFFIFRYFSRVYIRRFLRTWSQSWLSFTISVLNMAALIIVTESNDVPNKAIGIPLSFLAQAGSFFHIIYILIGSYQLVFSKPITRKVQRIITIGAVLLAIVTTLAFNKHPEDAAYRYLVQLGSRSFISGCGFFFAGLVVWMNPKFTRGIGQKLLSFSFVAFSSYQFFYLFIVVSNLYGTPQASLPGSSGLINLMMITMMSMSMVMWLLEDEREKLNKANKDLDSFLYSTSHDLRAPITSILGITYIGKLELREEKASEYMGMIEERVRKLNMILTDILSLSRAKKLGVKIENINFKDLVNETVSDIQFSEGAASIRLDFDKDKDYFFYSDFNQMKIILGNLITNAVKYHRLRQDDPYIKVTFERHNADVIISVEDNGQGIHPDSIVKIFDMFYRASPLTDGTGLGLYIVKEALSKIKGRIEVQSVFGKGTTFTVTLENV